MGHEDLATLLDLPMPVLADVPLVMEQPGLGLTVPTERGTPFRNSRHANTGYGPAPAPWVAGRGAPSIRLKSVVRVARFVMPFTWHGVCMRATLALVPPPARAKLAHGAGAA